MKKWILLMGLLAISVTNARAALLLEPYAGTIVNTKLEEGDEEKDVSGTAYGARVGFQNLGLMLGLDYQMATPTLDDSEFDYSLTHYGLFVGYDFPIMLRVWATYVMSGSYLIKGDLGNGEESELEFTKVSGTKFGIGYKVVPFVSINLEVMNLEFKDPEINGEDVSGSLDDGDGAVYLLSVSFPLSI